MNKNRLLTLLANSVLPLAALAIPAAPGLMQREQPDGTKVWFELKGDETLSWGVTADGYTLLPDAGGYWTVATHNSRGELTASDIRFKGREGAPLAAGIRPGLTFTREQATRLKKEAAARRAPASPLQVDASFPTKGKRKMLMLLVNFSDRNPIKSREDFDNYMNQTGYNGIGSFRDFYLENSYGQLDITTTVTRWVNLPYAHYQCSADNVDQIIAYALNELQRNGEINLADYDNNGDGVLDGLAVIHQGAGQEYTGDTSDIWSHTGYLGGLTVGGISVNSYTIQPELLGNTTRQSTIGVMCHEFGHNLGAPDFYDVDYESGGGDFPGTGVWDLMAGGSWNGDYGDRPAGVNMWQKIQYGWVEPTVLEENVSVASMPDAAFNPVCYRMETSEPGDYFIIENRQQNSAFDSALPGSGLIIYHANDAGIRKTIPANLINASFPQYMYTVCAEAGCDPKDVPASYGSLVNAPFPSSKLDSFDDNTLPSARSVSGRYAYCGLYDIRSGSDGTMAFNFRINDRPEIPSALTATIERGIVTLTWDYADMEHLDHFTVYRDGEPVATLKEKEFIDTQLDSDGMVTYSVDATLHSGLISGYEEVAVRIPANKITRLTSAPETNKGIFLQWDLDTRFSHMQTNPKYTSTVSVDGNEVEFAHRFRTEETAPYDGYSVKSITFCPWMDKNQASYTVRVWQSDRNGENAEVISEREVKEFGVGNPSAVVLSKKPVIEAGKELWISLLVKSKVGYAEYVTDYSELTEGLGNWMRIGDQGWKPEPRAFGNFYLYATLTPPSENHTEMRGLPDFTDPYNPWSDLSTPVGFAVYRDGEHIGDTSSRFFADYSYSTGLHTYEVASLYKNRNLSKALSIEVYGELNGLESVTTETAPGVNVANGTISLTGCDGAVSISHISGMNVFATARYSGEAVSVAPGIYVVRTGTTAVKVIVK